MARKTKVSVTIEQDLLAEIDRLVVTLLGIPARSVGADWRFLNELKKELKG